MFRPDPCARRWKSAGLRRSGCVALVLLTGCQSRVSVDVAADPPDNATAVVLQLRGVEFTNDAGGVENIDLNRDAAVDLLQYDQADTYLLLDDAELPEGHYTGVRLRFGDGDSYVQNAGSARTPISFSDSAAVAPIDFKLKDANNATVPLTLALDLRLSLSLNDNDDEWRMAPVLRAVLTDEAATLSGTVDGNLLGSNDCRQNRNVGQGVAVYVFKGRDVTPDDFDGQGVEPYATTPVTGDSFGSGFIYTLRFVPEGSYTVVLTCDADEEDPADDDSSRMRFRDRRNVELRAGGTQTLNINS